MPRLAKPLADTDVRNATPPRAGKPCKIADGQVRGLYLLLQPNDAGLSKLWRFKYRIAGKEKLLAIGTYPDVSLAQARVKAAAARAQVAGALDPVAEKQRQKAAQRLAAANTFAAVAAEWLAKQDLAPATLAKTKWMFDDLLLPWLGARPIADIKAPELLAVLRRIESRGKLETAQRVHQLAGRVMRYAVSTGRAERDTATDLRGALMTPKTKHRASITDPRDIGPLLRALAGYQGSFVTACALKLAPLLFVRPGELRKAEWGEFDLEAGEWRIPAAKMKMGAVHIVPLSEQALAALRDLWPLTGSGRYLFPSVRSGRRPMSENTVNAALRRMGYTTEQMTGHGFRSMASTRLHEMGWNHHAIERQLAHGERNKVSAAYNYAEHLPERRTMMQAWADYLDALRDGAGVVVAGRFGKAA